jgi:hypothetical protein
LSILFYFILFRKTYIQRSRSQTRLTPYWLRLKKIYNWVWRNQIWIFFIFLKGTVPRDFSYLVFFIKHLFLVPIGMPRNDLNFFRIFVKLFIFAIDSPAMNTPGSQLKYFRFGSFCKHKSHIPRKLK